MVGEDSTGEKMSLRRKIKPPKPFTGDVMDDLSSSIQGDRTMDSSEMQQSPRSPIGLPSDRSMELETSSEKVPPKKLSRKRASSPGLRNPQKVPRLTSEEPEPIARGRSLTRSGVWRPGAGMTPANNKKYVSDLLAIRLLPFLNLMRLASLTSMELEALTYLPTDI